MKIALGIFIVLFLLALAGAFYFAYRCRVTESTLSHEKEQTENYRAIFEKAHDAILVVDITDGSILSANQQLADMLGYSRKQIGQMSLLDLHPEDKRSKSEEVIADTWEKQGMVFEDLPFITADGDPLPVECSAKVMTYAHRPAITIYARDIRERLRMERQILEQKEMIEKKNKEITDSINYAQHIQEALLSHPDELQALFPQSFILFKPRDIVSGDFFWFSTIKKKGHQYDLVAAADCTGHGVPGAFMSMIGHTLLNNIVQQQKVVQPAQILNTLRSRVISALTKSEKGEELKDGMDIAICMIERKKQKLVFAGAHNPLYIVRENGEFEQIKADPFPIGSYFGRGHEEEFTQQTTEIQEGDRFYVFSDGFPDQFGSPSQMPLKRSTGLGKKYSTKRFKQFLTDLHTTPMPQQKDHLNNEFKHWKGKLDQLDDVLVIGFQYTE